MCSRPACQLVLPGAACRGTMPGAPAVVALRCFVMKHPRGTDITPSASVMDMAQLRMCSGFHFIAHDNYDRHQDTVTTCDDTGASTCQRISRQSAHTTKESDTDTPSHQSHVVQTAAQSARGARQAGWSRDSISALSPRAGLQAGRKRATS